MNNKGREGEKKASEYLEKQGYTILERNYRWRGGEVDLVARQGETLVFCEVKTWDFCGAEDLAYAINSRKIGRICRTAQVFLHNRREFSDIPVRFDVLFLSEAMTKIRHFPDAFSWSDAV